jgi:hypothetical protein
MYKQILSKISEEIDWMALTPLLLFFVVFAVVLIMALAEKKSFVDYMANMPLEKNAEPTESQS